MIAAPQLDENKTLLENVNELQLSLRGSGQRADEAGSGQRADEARSGQSADEVGSGRNTNDKVRGWDPSSTGWMPT